MIIYRSYIDHTQSGRILYYAESEETHYSLRVGGTTVPSKSIFVQLVITLLNYLCQHRTFYRVCSKFQLCPRALMIAPLRTTGTPPLYHIASEALCSTTSNRGPGHIHDKNVNGPG